MSDLEERLLALEFRAEGRATVRRVYLDSVDRGALRRGQAVVHEAGERGGRLEGGRRR